MASAKSEAGSTEVTLAPRASMIMLIQPLLPPKSAALQPPGRVEQPLRKEMSTYRTGRSTKSSRKSPRAVASPEILQHGLCER
jgi:hypothetical protein